MGSLKLYKKRRLISMARRYYSFTLSAKTLAKMCHCVLNCFVNLFCYRRRN